MSLSRYLMSLSRYFLIFIQIVLLCQKKASYTGPVYFKYTLGIKLTIQQ